MLTEEQVSDYLDLATPEEEAVMEEWFGIDSVHNTRGGKHIVCASLFWKNCRKEEGDLPELTRDVLMNARSLGLVTRHPPWEHYILPLLDAAERVREMRPDIVFRVYLAADLHFLIGDLVAVGCEVMLMKGSSIRHNPGAMWRFLALEEKDRWVTIIDSDSGRNLLGDIERTELIMESGHGLWRVPNILTAADGRDPGQYRPIIACNLGAEGGWPMNLLLRAFLWHTLKGTMPDTCRFSSADGVKEYPIFGTDWPSYGFDEWFLLAAVYPRLAFSGVLTIHPADDERGTHWFAMDIEYVTWANSNSEMVLLNLPGMSASSFAGRASLI